jgi:hypothetical protein
VLTFSLLALYRHRLAGGWRRTYVITAVVALYLNFFVLIVQLFRRVPPLRELAPTQSEPPFQIAQLIALIVFAVLGFRAAIRFRDEVPRRAWGGGVGDISYTRDRTALLFVDPYNDFLSEGGKLWPLIREVATEVRLLANLRTITAAGIQVFIVPHRRWEPGDFDNWDHRDGLHRICWLPVVRPLQSRLGGASDAFLLILRDDLESIAFSTYLEGSGNDSAWGVALDREGTPVVAGITDYGGSGLDHAG